MTVSEELRWRGFVQQTTFNDLRELDDKTWTFYHGFDASADSQTVGNLAAMMFDKVLMRHGHKAILLAGGATSLIGDPGGKDKERDLQNDDIIAGNVEKARQQLDRVFTGYDFTLVNNIDWTRDMSVLTFLRDIGKHFSMTPLVQRDYIAQRMGEGGAGISYTEFSYTLLQGMDFLHLYDTYGCTLQLGGSDQWGNCLSGVELIRKARGIEAHVITLPLIINKATGKKFGKSEEGAIWLDESKTSVYKFYQFWLNADDEGVGGYLKVYTELDKDEVDAIMAEFHQNKASRSVQKRLAYEVTKLVHGEERANSVQRVSRVLFGEENVSELTNDDYDLLKQELTVVPVGQSVAEVIVASGLASSKSEATRFIDGGAIYINGEKYIATQENPWQTGNNILKRGKNKYAVVEQK
ncbi:tyrosine--tRNA ligase [soil metagenome]